ncbi:MAG: hypothetical protein IJK97_08185 [Thermoguttaceae bacterium]|nr:hypothetical protein [Thermoguttaceae bacterium]MBR0193447.1 hypothetical protein [Thermoguttaceae bacterium]
MNNTVTQVIMCLAGLAIIAACCVYMINAGKLEAPKQQATGMSIEMLQQWEQAKKEAVEKETEELRKRIEELEEEVKEVKEKVTSGKPLAPEQFRKKSGLPETPTLGILPFYSASKWLH